MKILTVVLLVVGALSVSSFGQATTTPPSPAPPAASDKSSAVPTQRVVDCIKRITGLDSFLTVEKTERVSLAEINIPFLSPQLQDQVGIRVRFTPGKIKWSLPMHGVADPYVRYFAVYLDADANRVLAVTSRLAERAPEIHAEPLPEAAARTLRRNGNEVYDSFPADDPKITFMEALEAVRAKGVGYPPLAQEIDGFYLMYSRMGNPAHPVWVINMRGLPPIAAHVSPRPGGDRFQEPPVWQRNSMRNVVDAITGKWFFGSNSPGPE